MHKLSSEWNMAWHCRMQHTRQHKWLCVTIFGYSYSFPDWCIFSSVCYSCIDRTCEKFLCSGFFLWSALWNWPFLSPQDFGVAWEATFTQVPANEQKTGDSHNYVMNKKHGYESTVWRREGKERFLTPHSKTCIKLTCHYTCFDSLYSTENRKERQVDIECLLNIHMHM